MWLILFIVEVEINMSGNTESQDFYNGIVTGIRLHQQKVVIAHDKGEAIKINGELYYIQSGKERLQDLLNKSKE